MSVTQATGTSTAAGAGDAPHFPVPSKLWAARRAAQVLANGVRERFVPVSDLAVPRSGDDITPEWLTARLCHAHRGVRVVSIDRPGGSVGTTTRRSLHVTYNEEGVAAGLPTRLYVKCTTALAQRLVLGLGRFIDGEPSFYNLVRPGLDIEAPHGYFAEVDHRSWRSIVVMEDVAATKGAEFWQPSTYMSRGRIEDLLANTAVWHRAYWDSPRLRQLHWLKTPSQHVRSIEALIGMEKQSHVGHDRARDVLPAALRDRKDDLYEGLRRSVEISSRAARTYLHGDYHVGNTYVTADGKAGIGDWQIGVQGSWVYDYAYIVATALAVDDRRAWERDLLDFYLDRLAAHGGPVLDREAAFQAYREATFYPYYAWAYTIGRPRLAPKFQPDSISLPMMERTAAAIDDLESLRAVGI